MALSDDHKAALVKGRAEARTVKAYLDALKVKKPRGAMNSQAALQERLERLTSQIESEENSLTRLHLIQKRFEVEDKLKVIKDSIDFEALEAEFVAVAASYSNRKNVSYSAWREAGVVPPVLKAAGIPRTRRSS